MMLEPRPMTCTGMFLSRALFVGMEQAVREMRQAIDRLS